MKLEQRLRILRQERSAQSVRPPRPELESGPGALPDRLRRLSVREERKSGDEQALCAALGAEPIAPGVLRVERRFPLPYPHGRAVLEGGSRGLPALLGEQFTEAEGWLFLDTETSGLAGGTGTWAFLCGLARMDGCEFVLRQYLLTRLDAEAEYLDALQSGWGDANLLVTYNGKAFDVPLLDTRLRLAGVRGGLGSRSHLDLLFAVRRAYSRVWRDCRLATAEAQLLGFRRDGDLPGSEAPAAWLAWLRQGRIDPLVRVLEHNRLDLISLPALIPALERAFCDPVAAGADIRAIAVHHQTRGDVGRALAILEQSRRLLGVAGLLELARLYRRRGDWAAALAIWRPLAGQGDRLAIESLAKYLEHRARDYGPALEMARRLPSSTEREHRCRRLEERLRRLGACPRID